MAEDLAQETLYEAWRHRERLAEANAWRQYLNGIARHVCLRWHRRRPDRDTVVSGVSLTEPIRDTAGLPSCLVSSGLDVALERAEVVDLLDQAMARLPLEARELLREEYVEELPQAEIAARRGWTENNAAVRLHRGRAALKRTLTTTPELRNTAAAYGLLDADALAGWQETRLWCPNCGRARLEGRFEREDNGATKAFAVRCPRCQEKLGYDFSTHHAAIQPDRLLGDVKGYKPALNRLNEWWGGLTERAVTHRELVCASCGRPGARVQFTQPPVGAHSILRALGGGMYVSCEHCRRIHCLTPNGFAFHSAVGRAFYRQNPRMRLLPWRNVDYSGRPAVIVRMESLADSARLEIVLARDTYELLRLSGEAN